MPDIQTTKPLNPNDDRERGDVLLLGQQLSNRGCVARAQSLTPGQQIGKLGNAAPG